MFKIDVNFEKTIPNSQIAEIQNAYLSGMSLREAENHFDYFDCIDAAICLAIDKGWNIDASIDWNTQYMYEYFHNGDRSDDGLCSAIVNEAMDYIRATQAQSV